MEERDMYPVIARWLQAKGGCFFAAEEVGTRLGRIDVLGIRDMGGRLASETESIAVEAKTSTGRWAASVGQARGYSVFADRVYLAVAFDGRKTFSKDQILVAAALDVGLLAVRTRAKGLAVEEVTTSPLHRPIMEMKRRILERVGYGNCTVCGCVFEIGDGVNVHSSVQRMQSKGSLPKALNDERGIVYWLGEEDRRNTDQSVNDMINHRRYVCADCCGYLFWHTAAPSAD